MAEKHLHTVNLNRAKAVTSRKRTAKAVTLLREYVTQHTDSTEVSISNALNERMWQNGGRNPPKSVEVQIVEDDGTAYIELAEKDFEVPTDPEPQTADDEVPTDLADEDIAELNVDEVKDLVRDGVVDEQRALDIEYAGKNRKSLIEWLEDRNDTEEATDEASEDTEETYDLPEDVLDVFRDGTIGEGKDAAKDLGKSEFEKLLNFEEAHQNRKGMKQFLESNMN